jgi:VacB/RNase II family 3'-5' exoribonuclease
VPGVGDRILARLAPDDGGYTPASSRCSRRSRRHPRRRPLAPAGGRIEPVDRKQKELMLSAGDWARGREDWRELPLVTIDPPDAKDHDDAVHAEPDDDPANPGGVIVTVAIADVAAYVRPGSALDREARKRGNSVYFPDRVVPMLPERISNDLCSLREGEDRPALAVRMVFDADGRKRSHRFHRVMMRSAAKLSYEQAQAAIDGGPTTPPGRCSSRC